ncbi:hypothetical protein, partial [Ruegeria arenilitoris]|uniref:hypothetical protein n=1 Tax=Ruegeria arenilitoris TaxID=1173585 RepID=UPI001CFF4C09
APITSARPPNKSLKMPPVSPERLRRLQRPNTASAAPVKGVLRFTQTTRKWKIASCAIFLRIDIFHLFFK